MVGVAWSLAQQLFSEWWPHPAEPGHHHVASQGCRLPPAQLPSAAGGGQVCLGSVNSRDRLSLPSLESSGFQSVFLVGS